MSSRRFMLALGLAIAGTTEAHSQAVKPTLEIDWAALKTESEARKAVADARRAESEASTAEAKARFGTLADVATQGTTVAGDKAGQIEAAILSTAATRRLASFIVREVCAAATKICSATSGERPIRSAALSQEVPESSSPATPITACGVLDGAGGTVRLYVVAEGERPTFDLSETVQASLCGLQRGLERSVAASDRLRNGGAVQALAPAGIFTIANLAGNLLRSDYAVQGVAVTADDLLLAKTVAAASRGALNVPVALPSIYRPAALTRDNALVAAITPLDLLRTQATGLSADHGVTAVALGKRGKAYSAQAKKHADVASALNGAVKAYDDYLARIAAPNDKGVSELAEAARQVRMRSDLLAGAYLLTVKMNAAGGSTYTKKNFWTFLGGVPFFVSGGPVASFTLIEGSTGNVAASGGNGVAGGFNSIGRVHRSRDVQ